MTEVSTQTRQIEVLNRQRSYFDVSIDNISERKISIGDDFTVDYTVTNLGVDIDTQNVKLSVSGSEVASKSITLDFDESFSGTFTVDSGNFSRGSKVLKIESQTQYWSIEKLDLITVSEKRKIEINVLDDEVKFTFDELAIDDGLVSEKYKPYLARIYPREKQDSIIQTKVDSISYNPEVNSASSISVDLEPFSELEGESYLSSTLVVYSDENPVFIGEINKIATNQNREFYTVSAESPGKRLEGETLNENIKNTFTSDYVGLKIDKYNQYDSSLIEESGGRNEELTQGAEKIGKNVVSNRDPSQVTYKSIGESGLEIDVLRIKLYSSDPVDVNIVTENSIYNETVSSGKRFGEWIDIEPTGLNDEVYDIIFTFGSDSVLYHWVSIISQELDRDIQLSDPQPDLEGETIQSASENVFQFKEVFGEIDDTTPLTYENGGIKPLQTCYVHNFDSDVQRSTFNGGGGRSIAGSGGSFTVSIDLDYEVQDPTLHLRYLSRDAEPDKKSNIAHRIRLGGQEWRVNPADSLLDGVRWGTIQNYDVDSIGPGTVRLEVSETTTEFDPDEPNNGPVYFDVAAITDGRYDFAFDNDVTNSGYSNFPSLYSQLTPVTRESKTVSVSTVIDNIYLDLDNVVDKASISIENTDFFDYSQKDVSDLSYEPSTVSSAIKTKLEFIGTSPNGTRDAFPATGYDAQSISDFELKIDTLDSEVLYDKNVTSNKLRAITDIVDKSNLFYRWEGFTCKIFSRGLFKTDVDLRREDVSSSIDITDVYSSCEVVGDGVTSGTIRSENAPSFVDKHKQINEPDITQKKDAIRRAKSFLQSNGEIQYSGNIETLPTLAPLGTQIDGSLFNHGEDMYINNVRYSKRNTSIELGKQKNVNDVLLRYED